MSKLRSEMQKFKVSIRKKVSDARSKAILKVDTFADRAQQEVHNVQGSLEDRVHAVLSSIQGREFLKTPALQEIMKKTQEGSKAVSRVVSETVEEVSKTLHAKDSGATKPAKKKSTDQAFQKRLTDETSALLTNFTHKVAEKIMAHAEDVKRTLQRTAVELTAEPLVKAKTSKNKKKTQKKVQAADGAKGARSADGRMKASRAKSSRTKSSRTKSSPSSGTRSKSKAAGSRKAK